MSVKNIYKPTLELVVIFILLVSMIISAVSVVKPITAFAATDTFNSSGTWTAPAGVTSVTIAAWGGGGGGPSGTAGGGTGFGGGGGGAYSSGTVTVSGGSNYTVNVGSGGVAGSNGGDSWFNTSGTILAKGGSVGSNTTGGAGGDSASGIGTTLYSGGAGGNSSAKTGGGGGGSATATAIGGTGGAPTGGVGQGNGGDGGANQGNNGVNGNAPGGGGGGGGFKASSGDGAIGMVTVTYTIPVISVTVSSGSIGYGILGNSTSRDTTLSSLNNTQIATNDGNVAEDFNILGQNSANWTLAGSAGSNQYVHAFCTSGSGSPDPCDTSPSWTAITTSYQTLATNIAASSNKRFDLKITTPTTTSNYAQQSVSVTIQAVMH